MIRQRHGTDWSLRAAAAAILCAALATPACAQEAAPPADPAAEAQSLATAAPVPPAPPPGPLKVLSWNVATSPYAAAMRQIKSAPASWRTSFGSERRTLPAPQLPDASLIDADVVLLQGVTNPRALRRIFPARRWRLILTRRALENLPKGSMFTAAVSSIETEAIAVRFREGVRITTRVGLIGDTSAPGATPAPAPALAPVLTPVPAAPAPGDTTTTGAPPTLAGSPPAAPASPAGSAATGASPPAVPAPPGGAAVIDTGLAVKILRGGRTLWLASVALDDACAAGCPQRDILSRWRSDRRQAGEAVVTGGRIPREPAPAACTAQTIEAELPDAAAPPLAKGQARATLGCVAELSIE